MSLTVRDVTVNLAGRHALDGVSFHLDRGLATLRGPNGSGKSTLLGVIAGVVPADTGEVTVCGHSLRRERVAALRSLAWVPERPDLPGELSASEGVELIAALRGVAPPTSDVVARFGLREVYDSSRDAMSLGQRRRADLLGAFVGSPRVLLLDEPTNGLDVDTTRWLVERLRAHAADGGLALVATHDAPFAEALGGRALRLTAGRLTANAPPEG